MPSGKMTRVNAKLTNIQEWLRDHSRLLAISYNSSGRVKHKVTKGESREHQILDTLSKLLPTRISVKSNVVILDATDTQSPKFDGALIDYAFWPRIFVDDKTTVAMIESILAAIEVKSSLKKSDIADIFKKSVKLRKMRSGGNRPLITAFAYNCPNPNLSFFDFSTSFLSSPDFSPSLVCILNQHLFGLARFEDGKIVPVDKPEPDAFPVLFSPRGDTLLVYLYFLSRWVTTGTKSADLFTRYSNKLFSEMTCFHFDTDFLDVVRSNNDVIPMVRNCFTQKTTIDISELYAVARKKLNLSDSPECSK